MVAVVMVVIRAKRVEGRSMYLYEEGGTFRRDNVVQLGRRVQEGLDLLSRDFVALVTFRFVNDRGIGIVFDNGYVNVIR